MPLVVGFLLQLSSRCCIVEPTVALVKVTLFCRLTTPVDVNTLPDRLFLPIDLFVHLSIDSRATLAAPDDAWDRRLERSLQINYLFVDRSLESILLPLGSSLG
jgi:hypothetical protein